MNDKAREFLQSFLANGDRPYEEVVAAATEQGIHLRALQRAAQDLVVRTTNWGLVVTNSVVETTELEPLVVQTTAQEFISSLSGTVSANEMLELWGGDRKELNDAVVQARNRGILSIEGEAGDRKWVFRKVFPAFSDLTGVL